MRNVIGALLASALLSSPGAYGSVIGARTTGGLFGADTDGGIGTSYAYVVGDQTTNPESGLGDANFSYQAEATFNVGALTPVLRAEASSDDLTPLNDPFINADAFGLQTYQNISSSTQTYTLDLNLDGKILNAPGSSYIDAEVNIYTGTEIVDSFRDCSANGELLRGFDSWICGSIIDTGFLTSIEFSDDGVHSIVDTVTFDIGAGETFTIYGELRSLTFGGFADSFGTLSMEFEDISNLAALGPIESVPEPASLWIAVLGLVGLVISKKSRGSAV